MVRISTRQGLAFAVVIAAAVMGYVIVAPPTHIPDNVVFSTIKGEKISAADLRGKVTLVNFWATDCPGCVREMPSIAETYNKYHGQGFETIAVAMRYDPPNYVLKFAADNKLPFKVALDVSGELAKSFGNVELTPTTLIIGRDGKIIRQYLGEPDFASLRTVLESALKESA
jgi:peroxiredoxin